jgi:hypothetical protein
MSAPTYRTSDIALSIRAYLDVLTDEEAERDLAMGAMGFWRYLAEKFPNAPKDQVIRAWSIHLDQVRQEQEEIEAHCKELDTALGVMKRAGLTETGSYRDALHILAAQGDTEAIQQLEHAASDDSMVFMALFEAAVEAHPAWRRESEGHFLRDEDVEGPTSPESLVDWYQTNHGRAASQLETQVRRGLA